MLLEIARERGLFVEWSPRLGDWLRAYYDRETCTITLNSRLSLQQQAFALAHELGHAWHGHTHTGNPGADLGAERLADEYAARLLIEPGRYAAAEALRGPHPGAIADELGVHQDAVEVYQRVLRQRAHPILPPHRGMPAAHVLQSEQIA